MNSRLVIKSWGTELPEDVWTHQRADGGEAPHSSNKKCKRNSANVQQQEKLTSAPLKSSAPLSQLINTQHFLGEIADRESVCPGQQPTHHTWNAWTASPWHHCHRQGQAPGTNLMALELKQSMERVYTPYPRVCTHSLSRLGKTITNGRITPFLWISTGSYPLRLMFCL